MPKLQIMKVLIVSTFLLFCHKVINAQVSFSGLSLPYGKYDVGFTHYVTNDNTRTYVRLYDWNKRVLARPIPISIWFPSQQKSKNSLMTIEDYMVVLKEEEEWEELPNDRILDWFYYSNSVTNKSHLKEKVKAQNNTSPLQKKFPIVIYAPGYQASSVENFALCEFLASHGFIVISSPGRGTENRFLDGGTTRDIETQARDLEFLINEVGNKPYADINNCAVMGFSFGGISNVLAQMMNKRIAAIVCLDGSIKYQYQKILLSPYYDLSKVDVPFIFMSQKDIPQKVMTEDNLDTALNTKFEFYDSLKYSNAYYLKFNDLTHAYFSSMGILFQDRDARQDKSDSAIMNSYKWVNIYTLNFLNAFLNKNNQAKIFLENKPEENGVAIATIVKKSKEPVLKDLSFEDFNLLASRQNYQDLNNLLTTIKKDNPTFQPEEWKLNNLGLSLLFKNKLQEGINGYLIKGDKKKAFENFRKSLELNPQNQNAIDRLKELGN